MDGLNETIVSSISDARNSFFNDLSGEVNSQSEADVQSDTAAAEENTQQTQGADLPPEAVGAAVLEADKIAKEEAPVQTGVTPEAFNLFKEEMKQMFAKQNTAQEEKAEECTDKDCKQKEDDDNDDEEELNEEEFLDKFYRNPKSAIDEIVGKRAEKLVQGKLKPLMKQANQMQFRESVRSVMENFLSATTDAKDMIPDIANYIKTNGLPADKPESYRDAYREIKMGRMNSEIENLKANRGKSLEDYLSDEESVSKITENEAVKNRIIQNYLAELEKGKKPATIQSGGTAQVVGTEKNNPKSIGDAGKFFLDSLR